MTLPLPRWHVTQLTHGTADGRAHAHAYYDIPVFSPDSRFLAGHRVGFAGRQPTPEDAIEIGYLDLDGTRTWTPVGESRAWSWQQGALSQWLPSARSLIWNDREGDRFVARLSYLDAGTTRTLPRPVYAIDPASRFMLSLNMARLDHVRPGYGYPGGAGGGLENRRPDDDGVWSVDLETGEAQLILSLRRASGFLLRRLGLNHRLADFRQRFVYWFNHAKISPDGTRFTVKLRFRYPDLARPWNDQMGVSLTCGVDGSDLRLLARGTSHVIWRGADELYMWRPGGVELYADTAPHGRPTGRIAEGLIVDNVHIRHLPDRPHLFAFDTPYREMIDVLQFDQLTGRSERIARFKNHQPKGGPFRCDLHPCPSPDGRRVVVTSLQDGARQIYLLERAD